MEVRSMGGVGGVRRLGLAVWSADQRQTAEMRLFGSDGVVGVLANIP